MEAVRAVEAVHVRHFEPGQFTGREAEMERLLRWLGDAESRRLAIVGQGGSGKSTLAQWFLNCAKGVKSVGAARSGVRLVVFIQATEIMQGYRELLRRLKPMVDRATADPEKDEDVRGLVHALLRDEAIAGSWVCVLDDLPDPTNPAAPGWLLGEFPWDRGKTVVTSRFHAWTDEMGSADSFVVGCFTEDEAHKLLASRVEHWKKDAEGLAAVARRVGHCPLALVSAAGCAKRYRLSTQQYIAEL